MSLRLCLLIDFKKDKDIGLATTTENLYRFCLVYSTVAHKKEHSSCELHMCGRN